MDKRVLALRSTMKRNLTKENLDPRKWMRQEVVGGFADFTHNKDSDKETDNSFDDKEMCEYRRKFRVKEKRWEINLHMFYSTQKCMWPKLKC